MMLGLTLVRPWDQSIFAGPKRWENRVWQRRSVIGKHIALHAGQKWDDEAVKFLAKLGFVPPMSKSDSPAQAIVGVVKVICIIKIEPDTFFGASPSPWAFGPYAWELDDVRPLKDPVLSYPGALGLWPLTNEAEANVRAQVGL